MNAAEFDATTAEWLRYQASPRGRLRAQLLERGLEPHVPAVPGDVLDVGGGTGELALALTARGHRVTLTDYSHGMLALARERIAGTAIALAHFDLDQPNEIVSPGRYDLILCHNVIEYTRDPAGALTLLLRALRPGACLSVAIGNARHAALQSAVVHRDLPRASRELTSGKAESTNIFGTQTHMLEPEAVIAQIVQTGATVEAIYGIRCVSDLLDKDSVEDPANFEALLVLELGMMAQPAYRLMGRFVQIVARRGLRG